MIFVENSFFLFLFFVLLLQSAEKRIEQQLVAIFHKKNTYLFSFALFTETHNQYLHFWTA
jgi:hypothetical protein